jgi:GNAT superfamily N-acetyltransferase
MNELDRVEAQAIRDAVLLGGGRAELVGGAMCVTHPHVPAPELNGARPIGEHVDVGAISGWFVGHPHNVAVPPGYVGLEESLAAHGYERSGAYMKFSRDDAAADPPETDLRIAETADAAAFAAAMQAPLELCGFVGAPGWTCFLGWDGDEPAACGALYADGSVGWLGVGMTRPQYRRRGAQGALLAARVDAARALGVTRLTTETGEQQGPSYRNIVRAGFREAYSRPNWHSPR